MTCSREQSKVVTEANLIRLLEAAETSSSEHREKLFTALYDELHRMAQRQLRKNAALTLSPTTLLHETFLSVCQGQGAIFADRGRFMAYAARAMRGLLIDYLRSRKAQKRGGAFEITSLRTEGPHPANDDEELAQLAEALDVLARVDPRLAECIDLKFFCGFSYEEIAEMWAVSARTVRRDWDKARILLHRLLLGQPVE